MTQAPSPNNFLKSAGTPKPPRGKRAKAPPPEIDDEQVEEDGDDGEPKTAIQRMREFMHEQSSDITRFWDARSSYGDAPFFALPDQLWEASREYFAWCEEHPLWEAKVVSYKGDASIVPLKKMRAMTMTSLLNFLDISADTWEGLRKKPEFLPTVTRVESVIHDQKLQGGLADLLNANVVVRDLKLKDHSEVSNTGVVPMSGTDVTTLELAKAVALLLTKGVSVLDIPAHPSDNAKDVTHHAQDENESKQPKPQTTAEKEEQEPPRQTEAGPRALEGEVGNPGQGQDSAGQSGDGEPATKRPGRSKARRIAGPGEEPDPTDKYGPGASRKLSEHGTDGKL